MYRSHKYKIFIFPFSHNFHIHTVHLDIIKVFFIQQPVNCLKYYFKIDIKTAPTLRSLMMV